jgi:hypothetical protein
MPPFFYRRCLHVLDGRSSMAHRRRRLRSGLRLLMLMLMAASDSQHTPEHGGRNGQPSGNQAEDCHCKAHHYLHCFRVF